MVIAFGILPFECEGSLRNQMALEGCHELRATADLLVSLPNQNALAAIDVTTGDGQVWAHFSTITGNGYRSLARDEDVTFTYLSPGQDGYPHSAVSVTRHSSRARN